jgi:hypothetical protein
MTNEQNNQSQTKEIIKKEKPGIATKIGAAIVATAAMGAILTGQGSEKPQIPEQNPVSAEPNIPAPQKIVEGTILVARPNPRREASSKPVETPAEVAAPQPEITTSHDKNEDDKTNKKHHPRIDLSHDVIVLTPPAETTPPEPTPTPEPTPSETPAPIVVPK